MENYKGSIEVISGFKQKNNGTFPILNTEQIQALPDGTKLNVYLQNIEAGVSADVNAGNVKYTSTVSGVEEANVGEALDTLYTGLSDAMYEPITITTFENDINIVEIGSTVTDITFNFDFSKVPKTISINDNVIDDTTVKTYTMSSQSVTSDIEYTIKVTDERDTEVTQTTSIKFVNKSYYGVGTATGDEITNEFVLGLTGELAQSNEKTFTVDAGDDQYIYYCIPESFGTPEFVVCGFVGGFELVKTFEFTNESNHTESYNVYASINKGLGSTTVFCK